MKTLHMSRGWNLVGAAVMVLVAHVGVEHFQFLPPTLTVPVGATVTWVNHDEETHTVMSATGAFASAALETNDRYSYRFTAPGTYTYFCALHPHMKAVVVVQ